MVKIMENPIKMDDLGGFPIFLVQHPFVKKRKHQLIQVLDPWQFSNGRRLTTEFFWNEKSLKLRKIFEKQPP